MMFALAGGRKNKNQVRASRRAPTNNVVTSRRTRKRVMFALAGDRENKNVFRASRRHEKLVFTLASDRENV